MKFVQNKENVHIRLCKFQNKEFLFVFLKNKSQSMHYSVKCLHLLLDVMTTTAKKGL